MFINRIVSQWVELLTVVVAEQQEEGECERGNFLFIYEQAIFHFFIYFSADKQTTLNKY